MDIVLVVVAIILILIILVVYVFNNVKKTSDLNELFIELLKTKPDTVSFCLGKNSSTGKYRNVVSDKNGNAKIQEDIYPVNLDGTYIILKDHGTVVELPTNDGFKITGLDLIEFKCPDGFEGINCKLKPLCLEDDVGKYKPLTYTQFNELGLYTNSFEKQPIENRSLSEPTHPRIRVLCLNNVGDYELQTCPNNTLLDVDLKCQPYDICEDRINGYKHNYKIDKSSPNLNKNEYYICDNNVSTLTKCTDDTVFSFSHSGCITESVCFNKGNATLPFDDSSYIQCSDDQGKKITCPNGINNNNGVLSCHVDTCIQEDFIISDGLLSYKYGDTICNDGIADTKLCDNQPNPRVYNYEWAEKFTYTIDSWPKEIMDSNRNCVEPTDSIIANPIINLKWSDAMPEEHEYNIVTEQYVCPEGTKYIVDYKHQTINPHLNGIVNYLTPCINESADITKMPLYAFKPNFPPLYFILFCRVYMSNYTDYYLWPVLKNPTEHTYLSTTFEYSDTDLVITTYSSKQLPLGFMESSSSSGENQPLIYIGYKDYVISPKYLYFFAISGRYETAVLNEPTVIKTESIPLMSKVDTNQSITFALKLSLIQNPSEILPGVIFSHDGFKINDTSYHDGYLVMSIVVGPTIDDTAKLQIGEIPAINFVPKNYPTFTFY